MEERINQTTGLYNETLFEVLFNHEVARAKRYPSPVTLLRLGMCLNERNEDILETATLNVAHILNSSLRQVDVPAHCNENFWALLPATDEDGGIVVARRLIDRLIIEQITRSNQRFWMGLCIGLSNHPGGPAITPGELMVQATHALEEAMKRGQNLLVTYRELVWIS